MERSCSFGCRACQQGTWLCIFLTYLCDVECAFCPSPSREDKPFSVFGNTPEEIVDHVRRNEFSAISFSGGECFLAFDRMIEWLTYFRKHLSNIYYWVYTNGLSADEDKLRTLSRHGVNEIRFNIAATGYNDPRILDRIALSVSLFQHVAVEVPSIPEDFDKLAGLLPRLDRIGVNFLNLHEYILVPSDPVTKTAPKRFFALNGNTKVAYHALSRKNTRGIVAFCERNGLGICVNDCSLQQKEHQMMQRRRTMSKMLAEDFERVTPDGYLETCFLSPTVMSIEEVQALVDSQDAPRRLRKQCKHPDTVNRDTLESGVTCVLLTFVPPMAINTKRVLYSAEVVSRGSIFEETGIPYRNGIWRRSV